MFSQTEEIRAPHWCDLSRVGRKIPTTTSSLIVRVITNGADEKFVVLGGFAEFSQSTLNILADTATPIGEFDVADLKARIEDMERNVPKQPVGDELDREIQLLDQYRTLHQYITVTTAL
jgi:F-type H+-transporting ATPase subunit epsilon